MILHTEALIYSTTRKKVSMKVRSNSTAAAETVHERESFFRELRGGLISARSAALTDNRKACKKRNKHSQNDFKQS